MLGTGMKRLFASIIALAFLIVPIGHAQTITPQVGGGIGFGFDGGLGGAGSGPAPVLWTPSNLGSALANWWDAANTTKFTFNGSNVASWTDTKGGVAASQAPGAQPVYGATNVVGTGPGLTFDGSTTGLATSNTFTQSATWGIFVVIKTTITGTGVGAVLDADGVISPRIAQYIRINNGTPAVESIEFTSNGAFTASQAISSGSSMVYSETVTSALQTYINGTAGTPTATTGTGVGGNHILAFGASSGGGGFFAGSIGDVVLTNTNLTTSQRQKLEGYEAWKYGLQASLPSSNPYSSTGTLHRAPYVSDP